MTVLLPRQVDFAHTFPSRGAPCDFTAGKSRTPMPARRQQFLMKPIPDIRLHPSAHTVLLPCEVDFAHTFSSGDARPGRQLHIAQQTLHLWFIKMFPGSSL